MYYRPFITGQETLPPSTVAFRDYLQRHHLEPLQVALASGVRYLLVWRVWTGRPIQQQYEQSIRHTLFHLTGEPYAAPILVLEQSEEKEIKPGSSTPLRRIR